MAVPYDVEALIANIKRRASLPTSQQTFKNTDFADFATDILQGEVVPMLMANREEYFLDYVDVNADSQGIVHIPPEAVGQKLRTVAYVQQSSPMLLINLPRLDLDMIAGVGGPFINGMTFTGFYIQDNTLRLYPNTSVPTGTTIRLYYFKRTLALADPESYGTVISVDPFTNTVVCDYVPSSWGTGTVLNTVNNLPPFNTQVKELTVVTSSAPTIQLDSVDGIVPGSYISKEGYTGVPQIPVEAHSYLAQVTAAKCLEALGDSDGMKIASSKAEVMKGYLTQITSNRVDGSAKKIINPNGGTRLSSRIGKWRGSGGFF